MRVPAVEPQVGALSAPRQIGLAAHGPSMTTGDPHPPCCHLACPTAVATEHQARQQLQSLALGLALVHRKVRRGRAVAVLMREGRIMQPCARSAPLQIAPLPPPPPPAAGPGAP